MVEQLTLGLVIAAALADSINPCVFGVLIFLLAYMTAVFKNKAKMLFAGLIYIAAVYITYLLIGIGIFTAAYTAGIAIQCDYCIDSHSKKARAAGATPEELAFVVHLAAEVKHGATVSYGLKALQE